MPLMREKTSPEYRHQLILDLYEKKTLITLYSVHRLGRNPVGAWCAASEVFSRDS